MPNFRSRARRRSRIHSRGRIAEHRRDHGSQDLGHAGNQQASDRSGAGQAGAEQEELGRVERRVGLFQQPAEVSQRGTSMRSIMPRVSSNGDDSRLDSASPTPRPSVGALDAGQDVEAVLHDVRWRRRET